MFVGKWSSTFIIIFLHILPLHISENIGNRLSYFHMQMAVIMNFKGAINLSCADSPASRLGKWLNLLDKIDLLRVRVISLNLIAKSIKTGTTIWIWTEYCALKGEHNMFNLRLCSVTL